ncbi:MAG: hypothetical protein ACJ8AT_34415, partial [Hyalangium sp.]|uniref:hypothetical protein n=1 Tax=Hyalangium sp. TaxID=2028555 RepID=UPI0038998073
MKFSEVQLASQANKSAASAFSADRVFTFETEKGLRTVVVEPYTWSWLALNVAEGVAGGIAGEIAVGILFGNSSHPDFAQLVKQFVVAVERTVRQVLAEEAHRRLDVDLESLKSLIQTYESGRNRELLTPLLMQANRMTHEAVSLGLPTLPEFSVTAGIELMV